MGYRDLHLLTLTQNSPNAGTTCSTYQKPCNSLSVFRKFLSLLENCFNLEWFWTPRLKPLKYVKKNRSVCRCSQLYQEILQTWKFTRKHYVCDDQKWSYSRDIREFINFSKMSNDIKPSSPPQNVIVLSQTLHYDFTFYCCIFYVSKPTNESVILKVHPCDNEHWDVCPVLNIRARDKLFGGKVFQIDGSVKPNLFFPWRSFTLPTRTIELNFWVKIGIFHKCECAFFLLGGNARGKTWQDKVLWPT